LIKTAVPITLLLPLLFAAFRARAIKPGATGWTIVPLCSTDRWGTLLLAMSLSGRPTFRLPAFGAWSDHGQRDPTPFHIDSHHPDSHDVAHRNNIVRALDELVSQLADVNQP